MANVFPSALAAIQGVGAAPPSVSGITATMPPLTAAGVDLAKRTMWMIALAVVILVVLLMVQDFEDHDVAAKADAAQLTMIEAEAGSSSSEGISRIAAQFRHASLEPAWMPTPKEAAAAQTVIAQAQQAPSITAAQVTRLNNCAHLPAPATPDRATDLQNCATLLETISSDATPAHQTAFVENMLKALMDERAARRAFWLQVAQLILINLLLPILTALLGYIFGTRST